MYTELMLLYSGLIHVGGEVLRGKVLWGIYIFLVFFSFKSPLY